MSIRKLCALLALAIIISMLLSACAGSPETDVLEVDPRFGGVFNYASSSEPFSVDTHCDAEMQLLPLQALVMESLIAFGEGYSVVPMLAQSWEVSHNDTMYTFFLRRGIKFHNGKEMTSEDVIASLERYFDVGYRASAFNNVKSFEAVDDYTIRIQIVQPTAAFLYNLAMPEGAVHIYPKEIIQDRPCSDLSWDDLIGTGPYRLVEHKANDVSVFRRFEEYQPYPGKRDGLGGSKIAFFDEIRVHIVRDYAVRLAGLQNGEFDWIQGSWHDIELVNANPDLSLTWDEHAGAHHLLFNHAISPTDKLRFRQAIRALLDVEEFGMAVWEGCRQCFRLNHSLWPVFSYHYINDRYYEELYNQKNQQMAKVLTKVSGYDGHPLVCIASTDSQVNINACEYLQEVLKRGLGIDVIVEALGQNDFLDRISQDETWNIAMVPFPNVTEIAPGWYTPVNKGNGVSTNINIGYVNDEMNAANTRIAIATTYEQRLDCLKDIQRIAYEDVIDIKLWDITTPWIHKSNIMGYEGWYVARFFGVWRE